MQRFHSKYERKGSDECWPWTRPLDRGYGRFWLNGRTHGAHRVAYELAYGQAPSDAVIDHLCRNTSCVNPAHLEAVTNGENVLRGEGITAKNARRTECVNGHALDEGNTYVRQNGSRSCVACQRRRVREWRARKAAA